MNISCLPHHFKEFSTILSNNKLKFDFLGISEPRIKLNRTPIISIQLPRYNLEYTPTESINRGTLLYIKKGIKYKCRKDLQIYKLKELESTLIEVNQKNKKLIVGCIYRHPSMDLSELNNHFLPFRFEKLSYGNKIIVLLGDFNANLINYDSNTDILDFLNCMYCNSLLPHTPSPTRITARSKILTDNIFSSAYDSTFKSGNQITTSKNTERQYYRDFTGTENKKMKLN